jgi:hypothetical protein
VTKISVTSTRAVPKSKGLGGGGNVKVERRGQQGEQYLDVFAAAI